MTKLQTQKKAYWASPNFALTSADIEQIYNYFLESELPQTIEKIARVVIKHRINEEKNKLKPLLDGRIIYQPLKQYKVGDELVFPMLEFAHGSISKVRKANNPQFGEFQVIKVDLDDGKEKEFAAELDIEHPLNEGDGMSAINLDAPEPDELYELYGEHITRTLEKDLDERDEFICLANKWFIKGLMAEINMGHLHLAEAVLEVSEGGPLQTSEVLVHLDIDAKVPAEVQEFSLNHGLLSDDRFDEVAPPGQVFWFLRRLEPDNIRETPFQLVLNKHSYDPALLGSQMRQLEREIDDEWSDLEPLVEPRPVTLTLNFSHRWAGTLPLSARTRPLFPLGVSSRQLITFVDDETNQEIQGWVVADGRYIVGLEEWYKEHEIPVGGYINLAPGPDTGIVKLGYNRRPRPRREYVRLATVEDGRLRFSLDKRAIGCDYDDLLIVGTDYLAALETIYRSGENQNRTLASLLVEIMPSLGEGGAQNAVHSKTIYSAVNMLRRVTPGAVFAELMRHPAFQAVGDQYWQFNSQKWQGR